MVTPPLRAESSSVKGVTPPTGVKAGSPHLRQVLRERGGAAPSQRAGTPRTQPEGTGLGSLLCRGGWPQFPHLCHGPASKPSRSPSSGYLGPLLPLSFLQPQWVPGQGGTLGPRPASDLSVPALPTPTYTRPNRYRKEQEIHPPAPAPSWPAARLYGGSRGRGRPQSWPDAASQAWSPGRPRGNDGSCAEGAPGGTKHTPHALRPGLGSATLAPARCSLDTCPTVTPGPVPLPAMPAPPSSHLSGWFVTFPLVPIDVHDRRTSPFSSSTPVP